MECDDCLRPLQLPLQPAVLGLELFHPRVDGAWRRAPAAPAHCLQGARLALPPPVRQERRVQPLATQQGAHLAGPLARVDFLEDAEPIRGGEAPLINDNYFGRSWEAEIGRFVDGARGV